MPYPNEHSARIVEPGKFDPKSFRRKTVGKGISIIMGKLKGETTMTTQAYRFPKSSFTAAEAKAWLEEHKIKFVYHGVGADIYAWIDFPDISHPGCHLFVGIPSSRDIVVQF